MAASGGLLGLIALFGYLAVPGVYQLCLYWQDRSNTYALTAVLFTSGFALYCLTEVAINHDLMVTFYTYMQVALLVTARCHQKRAV